MFAYLREGPRAFRATGELFDPAPGTSAYAVMPLRPRPGLHWITVLGQGCGGPSPPSLLQRVEGRDGYPRFSDIDPIPADNIYNANSASPRRTSDFAPMAGCAGDIDGDDSADLFLSLDPFQTFFLTGGQRFVDVSEASRMSVLPSASGALMIPWGAALLDLDRDTFADIVVTHGNDPAEWMTRSRNIGPQTTTAALSARGMYFVDASRRLGLDRAGQWRALSVGDPDRDGDPDLIVGGQGEGPRVYRNDIVASGHALSLRLVGTTSGVAATGARVTVEADGLTARAWVGLSGSPDVVPAPVAFLATGAAPRAERVVIDWPSGTRQVLRDVEAGASLRVVEPEALRVEPASRASTATDPLRVVVTPRDDAGAAREGVVSARVYAGACELGAPSRAGESWVVEARASASGSCVVEASVDGVAIAARPRLWWR
ncbi:MAG: CRTAC1 family protein [Polyangiales bacterium]